MARIVRPNKLTKPSLNAQPRVLASSTSAVAAFRMIPTRGMKQPYLNRYSHRAIAREWMPGANGAVFFKDPIPAPPENHVQPWHLTSGGIVAPTTGNVETVLIQVTVPSNTRMRLVAHNQFLEDGAGQVVEDDLIWMLRVGGVDILNPFMNPRPGVSASAQTGRIIRANNVVVPFGNNPVDLPVLAPGTVIQYVVRSRGTAPVPPPSNKVAATLIGVMWGDKGV